MRIALFLIALLALTGEARADVFVPADPSTNVRETVGIEPCASSAGDVAVKGVQTLRGWNVSVREGSRPWRRLTGLSSCPSLSVAADGTAAITAGEFGMGQLVIRDPGGAFGATLKLAEPPSVEVAPGGRVVAVWPDPEKRTLTALARDPGGAGTRTVLDRGFVGRPRLAIDAGGTATAVWTHADRDGEAPSRLRMARSIAGAAWSALPDLPAGDEPLWSDELLDLAVSPNGHTLVTWITGDGVQAMLDSEPSGTVAYAAAPGSPRAVITDTGAAVIVFGAGGGRVFAVERPAGGGWLPARQLSGSLTAERRNDLLNETPTEIDAAATLQPDGRVLVAWTGDSTIHRGSLVAVAGRLGGAWQAPVRLSSPVRWFAGWSFDPGVLGLQWREFEDDERRAMLRRGAHLVADAEAPPPDRIAPEVTTRLPSRLPRTTTGRLRLRVPVRCAEACVVRVEFADESVTRELAAGATTTFPLGNIGTSLLAEPGLRRLPLLVLAADRAGNLTKRSQSVRVRVARMPLRSFKVSEDHDFSMYSKASNRAVARLVNSLIEGLAARTIRSERELRRRYLEGYAAIERAFPAEELDTPVVDEIYRVTEPPFTLAGYSAESVLSG